MASAACIWTQSRSIRRSSRILFIEDFSVRQESKFTRSFYIISLNEVKKIILNNLYGYLQLTEYIEQAVALLQKQNELLAHHPNASLYDSLTQFVEFDGYYLESEPCLVCNNPEVPLTSIKLSSIKVSFI